MLILQLLSPKFPLYRSSPLNFQVVQALDLKFLIQSKYQLATMSQNL